MVQRLNLSKGLHVRNMVLEGGLVGDDKAQVVTCVTIVLKKRCERNISLQPCEDIARRHLSVDQK